MRQHQTFTPPPKHGRCFLCLLLFDQSGPKGLRRVKAALKGGEGIEPETACAENRFATEGESLAIINMLADLQVTPCTLNDVL